MKISGKATKEERLLIKHLIETETMYRLDKRLCDEMISLGEVITVDRCEVITETASVDTNVYILMDGIIRSWYWNGDNEKTAYFAGRGTIFMSLHSYLNGEPSTSNFESCCECRIFRISKQDYDSMIDRYPDFTKWALSNALYQLYYYEFKDSVINGTPRQRYDALVSDRPEILHRVHLKTIASYLGITPQYLSRIRNSKK